MTASRVIAIDGPAGSGKSTVARRVAAALGFVYVDTGAIYRGVALVGARRGLATDAAAELGEVAASLDLRFASSAGGQRVFVGDEEVTAAIRDPHVSMAASAISAHPQVRTALLDKQRALATSASHPGAVLEGRDIGTVVFPDAGLKIFLSASVEERARRRHQELQARGQALAVEEVVASIRSRDESDQSREHAPLKQAEDAVFIDSTRFRVDEVVQQVVELARLRMDHRDGG